MSEITVLAPPLPKKTNDKICWGELHGASIAMAIAHAANQADGPLIIITPDTQSANRLERELKIFLPTDLSVWHFPDWETLPYDNFSPHEDIISDRLLVLSQLPSMKKGLLVVPITTLLYRITPKAYIAAQNFSLKIGDTFDFETIRKQLVESGYQSVSQVMTHGEFATRGNIIDIFPMGSDSPIRIDLFDNEIETLRLFDPETQRSDEKIASINCLPAREFPLTEEAIALFRQQWRAKFSGDPALCNIYQDISQGRPSSGIEYYLPLFFESTGTLFDYIPASSTIIRFDNLEPASKQFWHDVEHRYEQYRHDIQRPILAPNELFIQTNELFAKLKDFSQIHISFDAFKEKGHGYFNFGTHALAPMPIETRSDKPLAALQAFLAQTSNRVLLCAESPGRREIMLELLKRHGIHPKLSKDWHEFLSNTDSLGLVVAPIDEGVALASPKITWIAESQLYGQQVMQRRRRKKETADVAEQIRDLSELNLGAPLVHIDHGVGRYRGLVHLSVDGILAEYMILEYADNDKLYVPVASLHLISQYSGAQVSNAPLHKLGTELWDKAKKKASQKAYDVAAELLDIYAKRGAKKGHRFSSADEQYFQFASSFPFEETEDQAKAIAAVLDDMKSEKSMDRLVCGDVGFGKTEVALRAAFVAVQDGKQVVLLVPTTLLAQQHYETFTDRFADWPVRIEVLSRFRSKKDQERVLSELAVGSVDIIIGTHKLIQENVKLKNLGLVIIDEEHRFGVRQKERLKALRQEVDILTLTATPIPRTLNMALSSLRDLSIIATAPAKRLSIKTFVREYHKPLVEEAIMRELMRGGQVYYLHNDVDTIEKVSRELAEALPQARVDYAHGQMRERQLEHVMSDFYHQRFNVLVCTTIIETGIDIPSANTIIIDRADKLGLAQLHQLRGRVGRSHHQAYAYCLTPPEKKLSADAIKRLQALESLEELGSGFTLATHDLEIRGAGELLGEEQSGDINAIGFSLYMELLDRAIHALKSGKKADLDKPLRHGATIDLQVSALIPEDYLADVHTRLVLYKRIANAKQENTLNDIQVEMIDRFGLLPQATKDLFRIAMMKIKAEPIGIKKIEAGTSSGKVEFEAIPNIDPDKIIQLIRNYPRNYKLMGQNQFKFIFEMETPEKRFACVENILRLLTS